MTALAQDLRYALRQLRKNAGFSVIVVLMLALGIGANSALFGIVNAVLLRPLPYPTADRIVSISLVAKGNDMERIDDPTVQVLLQEQPRLFTALAASNGTGANFAGGAAPERVSGARISANFFRVMGMAPALGRSFATEELQRDGPPVVILGHGLWARDFGSDPRILGQAVKLDDKSYTVVGVMPAGFRYPDQAEYWLPLTPLPSVGGGGHFFVDMVGRLAPGVSVDAARAELMALRRTHAAELPAALQDTQLRVMSLHERMYGDLRPALLILLGTVGCVLLIACANVANLLLARAASRRKELALRAALGASRTRLVRQLTVESLVLAILGGACGLLLPVYGLHLFASFGPRSLTSVPGIAVDGRVLAFTLGVSVLTGLLFGLAPALTISHGDLHDALKDGGTRMAWSVARGSPRRVLVTAELAIAMVLLIGAGLLAKSFVRFHAIDPGFHAAGVLTADLALPSARYPDSISQTAFYRRVLERVRALPGVEAAALTQTTPLGGFYMSATLPSASGGGAAPGDAPRYAMTPVGTEYFRTFGIPLRAGREFTDADDRSALPAAVISESMARIVFGHEPAVGKQLTLGGDEHYTVVGVAADVRQLPSVATPLPAVYTALRQAGSSTYRRIALRARAGSDPLALAPAVRQVVRSVDPEQPISSVRTMEERLADSMAPRRFNALLLGAFAVLALLLAASGLYGLIAYLVAQRTHEIGVRMALGAERRDVLALVLRQGLTLTLGGVVVGFVAAFALTRLLASMLFDVTTTDPVIFVVVPLVLIAVAVMATLLPARRAARVDPMIALRAE
jgi:putative ABC transport system permease protein